MSDVRRLDLGYFVRPAAEVGGAAPGRPAQPRVEPVLGYLVKRDEVYCCSIAASGRSTPGPRRIIDRVADFDPRRVVLFAHDCSVWEP